MVGSLLSAILILLLIFQWKIFANLRFFLFFIPIFPEMKLERESVLGMVKARPHIIETFNMTLFQFKKWYF